MILAPTLAEIRQVRGDVKFLFVACDIYGCFRFFAVVDMSRHDMGTARPLDVASCRVEFVSRDEFNPEELYETELIVRVRGTDFVLVADSGDEIKTSPTVYTSILKQRDQNKKLRESIMLKENGRIEYEALQQARRTANERQEEVRLKQQQINFAERLAMRKARLQTDLRFLKMFPELEKFRAVLRQECKAHLRLEKQNVESIDNLLSELHEADKREESNLFHLRRAASILWQEHLRENERRRLVEQRQQERKKQHQIREDEAREHQERLQAEKERIVRKNEQIEQNRSEQLRKAQQLEQDRLKMRKQQIKRLENELLYADCCPLLALAEAEAQFRILKVSYGPNKEADEIYRLKLDILIVRCKKGLKYLTRSADEHFWVKIIAELKATKSV